MVVVLFSTSGINIPKWDHMLNKFSITLVFSFEKRMSSQRDMIKSLQRPRSQTQLISDKAEIIRQSNSTVSSFFLNYQALIIEILETTHIVKTPKCRYSSDRKRCYTYIAISQLGPCKWNHIDQLSKKCWMIFLRLCLPNLCDEVSLQGKPKEVHFSSSWIKRLQTKGSPESFESHKVTFLPKEHEASIE